MFILVIHPFKGYKKNTWIYLNPWGKLFWPEQHLQAPGFYLNLIYKIQAPLASFLHAYSWKTPEKSASESSEKN